MKYRRTTDSRYVFKCTFSIAFSWFVFVRSGSKFGKYLAIETLHFLTLGQILHLTKDTCKKCCDDRK